ncbi:MAG: DUF4870 domain-containing protein [Ruminococcus sp.]|nr:DUF4870 domain-containing protein [Ruminococcus sp.]
MDNFLEQFNDINTEQTFVQNEVQKHKALAILAYIFPFLCWLPTVAGDKNSTYCKFHGNQSLTWLITLFIVNIVRFILGKIPVLGVLCSVVISLALFAVLLVYLYGAYKGKAYRMPFIGSLLNVF